MLRRTLATLSQSALKTSSKPFGRWFAGLDQLVEPGTVIVDCSGQPAYERAHLAGARCLPVPPTFKQAGTNSVSSAAEVQECAAQLGIGKDSKVIAYDDMGGLFAARFWWVMSMYGHEGVQVLHAGWRGAANSGASIESGPCQNPPSADVDAFSAQRREDWFVSTEDMVAMSVNPPMGVQPGATRLVDVRSPLEVSGEDLRGNPVGGHVRGSFFLPHNLFSHASGAFPSQEEAMDVVKRAGIDLGSPLITMCQSGVRASHTALVLRALGAEQVAVYDESMGGLARQEGADLETGAPPMPCMSR